MSKRTVYIDGNTDHVVSPPGASQLLKSNFTDLSWNNILQDQEVVTVAGDGQTDFTITQNPLDVSSVLMFVNGIKQQYLTDYVVYGRVVTYIGTEPVQLLTTDTVEFWYVRGEWTPPLISDISGWWDVSDYSSLSLSGSDVDQWSDKSGLARHLTATVPPEYEAAGWNGNPSVLFNGTDEYMIADAVAADFSGDDLPMTIIMAMQAVTRGVDGRA